MDPTKSKRRANAQTRKPGIKFDGGGAKGAGYGGAAKGANAATPTFDPERLKRWSEMSPTERSGARARRMDRVERMYEIINEVAEYGESGMTRHNAAKTYIERMEGLSIARTITATVTDPDQLTDADLAAIAAGSGAAAADKATDQD